MSLQLNFEPHSYYMGFAIKKETSYNTVLGNHNTWLAFIDNGNTYRVDELGSNTLKNLKDKIKHYHLCKFNGYGERIAKRRLEHIRDQINNECISYNDQAELFRLHEYIKPDDVQLREWVGMPERG